MSEETDAAIAVQLVFAEASPVLTGMEPALEYAMRVLARVTVTARAFAELGARNTAIVVFERVTSASVLSGVHEGALCPVVGVRPRARFHLEGVHSEVVGAVDPALNIRESQVRGEILLEKLFKGLSFRGEVSALQGLLRNEVTRLFAVGANSVDVGGGGD